MNESDPYVWPGSTVLRNKLGITDPVQLDIIERRLAAQRAAEGIPTGRFDLANLCAIHRHLFQDVYDWSGRLRTVKISKGGHQFQSRQYIATGMGDVHRRLIKANFLRGLGRDEFAAAAGGVIGDVNYVHPFREGAAIHETARDLHAAGLVDRADHAQFRCRPPDAGRDPGAERNTVPARARRGQPSGVRALSERDARPCQPVGAGRECPRGASLKLLSLVARNGLDAVV